MAVDPLYLVVDLFCGAGGTTIGFEKSEVAKVIAAVNHDPKAIESHWVNHPNVKHFEEDIRTLDLAELIEYVRQQRIIYPKAKLILWASLECTNFSKAKGGQSRDADSRTLADHLHRYVEPLSPDEIMIENVVEFMSWGPLDKNGKPISRDKGVDFVRWNREMCGHGYHSEWKQLNSADFGARTSRNRLFGNFIRKTEPFCWPEPTHAKNPEKTGGGLKKWVACRPCLDLDDHGTSIFTPGKIRSDKTFERIHAGLWKFVAGMKQKDFLLKYNSQAKNGNMDHSVMSIENPSPTIAAQRQPNLLSTHFIANYYSSGDNTHSIEAPSPTLRTGDGHSMISTEWIDRQFSSEGQHNSLDNPAGSVMPVPKMNLVNPQFILDSQFNNVGKSLDEPMGTITANRKWHYLMNPQYFNNVSSIDSPCFTLIARMDKAPPYLVEAEGGGVAIEVYQTDTKIMRDIKWFMAVFGIIDIKMRMLKVVELKRIQGFPEDYVLKGNQADQKKFIGNSVQPDVVVAWIKAKVMDSSENVMVA
jgi:DNA (cytosine-5)-methyltransferase 1